MQFTSALPAVLTCALLSLQTGCNKPAETGAAKPVTQAARRKIAFVTNGVDPFWNTAAAGVRAATKEFDIDCEVLMPPKGISDQKRMIEGLLARGIDGVAIS